MTSLAIDQSTSYYLPKRWQQPLVIALVAVTGVLVLFHQTLSSMISAWWYYDSFSHGFVIFPISAWLIWNKRRELASIAPQPDIRALFAIFATGFIWLFANLLDIAVAEQFAMIAILIEAVWCVLGKKLTKTLLFPLGFLFFAVPLVPLHDALVLPMIDFTADFTVRMVELSGIPIFREGNFISLASGNWEVNKACAGVRYLIASVVLGTLYAYLAYTSLSRRLIFVAFSMVVPVFANGLRAYLIVVVGHFSDMRLAVGVDHLIYGWLFFGLMMTVMFLVGSIWRQPSEERASRSVDLDGAGTRGSGWSRNKQFVTTCLAALLAAAIWPGAVAAIKQIRIADNRVELIAPDGVKGWQSQKDWLWAWWPRVERVDGEFYRFYRKGSNEVSLYVGQFRSQREGVELTDTDNVIVGRGYGPNWLRNKPSNHREVQLTDGSLKIIQSEIHTVRSQNPTWTKLLVWRWYRLGDRYPTSNPYLVRLFDAWARLTGARRDAALIVVATPLDEDIEAGEQVLRSFTSDMLPRIESVLERSVLD